MARAGSGAAALALVLLALLPTLTADPAAGGARLVLVSPEQGQKLSGDTLIVRWRVEGFTMQEDGDRDVVLVVNGRVMHVSRDQDVSFAIDMSETPRDQPVHLRMDAMLCTYDIVEGISDVLSSAQVECSLGDRGAESAPSQPSSSAAYTPAREAYTGRARGPVVIFVFHCNRPSFLRLQAEALRRFMLDEYVLIVIDDAPSDELRGEVAREAVAAGAKRYVAPDYFDHSDPSVVVGKVVTWAVQEIALKEYGDSVIFLLEGDMFPVAPFSPLSFIEGYGIAGTHQGRRHKETGFLLRYLWVGFLLVDLQGLPNKELLNMERAVVGDVGGDTASALHHFLEASPELRVRRVLHTSHVHGSNGNLHVLPEGAREGYKEPFRIEFYERAFLHYGNWKVGEGFEYFNSPVDFLPEKTRYVEWFVRSCVQGSLQAKGTRHVEWSVRSCVAGSLQVCSSVQSARARTPRRAVLTMHDYAYTFGESSWDNPSGPARKAEL